jgi:hypothetical protein
VGEKRQLVGDYNYTNVAGIYEPDLSAIMPHQQLNGMTLQSQYIYGGFTTTAGRTYIVERKFVGPMSGGNYILGNASGSMELLPESGRSAKGEMVREIEPLRRNWKSKGMLHDSSELPIDLTLTDDHVSWAEGDALELSGPRAAHGVQFFAPARTEPLGYASQCYWVTGTILGEAVEGPVFFDHLYFQHGAEWKEYRWYIDLQISWNVFANKFSDGTMEFGHIVRGRQGWSAGVVVEGDRAMAVCTDVRGDFTLDDEGYVTGGAYDLGPAGTWNFTGDSGQQMGAFNKARWGGYRAQGGLTRRQGDDRKLVNGWTWLECFADRIKSEGLVRG